MNLKAMTAFVHALDEYRDRVRYPYSAKDCAVRLAALMDEQPDQLYWDAAASEFEAYCSVAKLQRSLPTEREREMCQGLVEIAASRLADAMVEKVYHEEKAAETEPEVSAPLEDEI